MIHFQSIDTHTFLKEYWQKKPLVIRNAIPDFTHPITGDDLAGLAMEEDIESRIVYETKDKAPFWHLERGPFDEQRFTTLPSTHWTLLVQGVDRVIPEVMLLLDHFNFIPQWRVDDVMISYAVKEGSVGPHYDHYDVFLYQAQGRRKWSLTSKNCHPDNYLEDVDLRIMAEFEVEETFILEPGDMLYLPPHIGHHGVSLSDDCMTYSFGFRSYDAKELLEDFGDFLVKANIPYQDPDWRTLSNPANISSEACLSAKQCMQVLLNNEPCLKSWFGTFVTRPDRFAEQHMPYPLDEDEVHGCDVFMETLAATEGLIRDGSCRMAIMDDDVAYFFMNGTQWSVEFISWELVLFVANNRLLLTKSLLPLMKTEADHLFLYELWTLQCLQWYEVD